jgi:hypothetical protein
MADTSAQSGHRLNVAELTLEGARGLAGQPTQATLGPASEGRLSKYGARVARWALWTLAAALGVALVYQRYRAAVSGNVGADFQIYLRAAHSVAAGRNPYRADGAFVYPPTLALLLAPFIHADPGNVFRGWTVLELLALVVGVTAFVAIQASKLSAWLRPVLFILCLVTVFHFWPLTVGLFLGQADAFVFAALMLSAWAASRDQAATRGALIALAGLLKTWPGAVVLVLWQRGTERRLRAAVSFVVALLVAPVLALVIGGASGLTDFVKSVVSAGTQHLVSDSVWGAPSLLFSNSGLARPLAASVPLQVVSTAVLLIWVVGLLTMALRTAGDQVMATWNVTFCVVLLLPVSHLAYSLYGLPVLWLWMSYLLADKLTRWPQVVVPLVLLLWWVVQTRAWPDTGSSPAIGSLHYVVIFGANLVACTASVIGARFIRVVERPAPDDGGPIPSEDRWPAAEPVPAGRP